MTHDALRGPLDLGCVIACGGRQTPFEEERRKQKIVGLDSISRFHEEGPHPLINEEEGFTALDDSST